MDADQERRFGDWLHEHGIEGRRRVVRATAEGILVSKFEPGFAAHLHDVLDRVAQLLDAAAVAAHYRALAGADAGSARVATWHQAAVALLARATETGIVSKDEAAEVEAGVDSVAALLDSVLWSGPACGADWMPSAAEQTAFAEALERMDDANSLFTRHYGDFEGAPVENHCPGARVARRLLEQAWTICTAATEAATPTLPA